MTMEQLSLFPDLVAPRGASAGQRRLIFVTARTVGLREGQLRDLAERASDYRTRGISALTVAEANRLIGLLKTLERSTSRVPEDRHRGAA
jgi:hypothetical protein